MGKSNSNIVNAIYYKSPYVVRSMAATIYGYRKNRESFGKYYYEQFEELKETEYLSNNKLENIQFIRLKSFLEFVYLHSPYYKHIFDVHQFNPTKMQYQDEIKKLPILEKEEVRKNGKKISCEKYFENNLNIQTSGSTGKPLNIIISNKTYQIGEAFGQLLYSWNDLDHNNRMARFAGQFVATIKQKKPPFWVYDCYNRNLYFSSYHLNEENLKHYIKKLKRFKPEILEGYPSSIYLLALANKKYSSNINPILVRTGSETLLDYQRKSIQDSFGCKVYNMYGSKEYCAFAIECPQGKMHLQSLYGYTELINDYGEPAKPGETAMIIATGFNNRAFPLIRYNTGDLAILSKDQICGCRRGGLLLDTIIGRIDDFIVTADGRKIGRMANVLHKVHGVVNCQIIQGKVEEIVVKIVKDNIYNDLSEKRLIKNLIERLGSGMDIKIQYVNGISKEKNGKYRFILSKINKEMFGEKLDR